MSQICSWCINLSQIFEYSIELSRIIICCANVLIYDKYKEYYKTVKILQYDTDIAQIFVYVIEISQMFRYTIEISHIFGYTIEISQIFSCSTDLSHIFGCSTDLDYGLELSHIWLRHNCFTTPICVWNWCFKNIRRGTELTNCKYFLLAMGPGGSMS